MIRRLLTAAATVTCSMTLAAPAAANSTDAVIYLWGVENHEAGTCLQALPTGVAERPCQRGLDAQRWRRVDATGGTFELVAYDGRCLQAAVPRIRPLSGRDPILPGFANVTLGRCTGSAYQRWHNAHAHGQYFRVVHQQSRWCLAARGAGHGRPATTGVAPCLADDMTEHWRGNAFGPPFYR